MPRDFRALRVDFSNLGEFGAVRSRFLRGAPAQDNSVSRRQPGAPRWTNTLSPLSRNP